MKAVYNSTPFKHWVIDEFVNSTTALAAYNAVPKPDWCSWVNYDNDCERFKRTNNKEIMEMPAWQELFAELNDQCTINALSDMVSLPRVILSADPTLHGAGCHVVDPGGYLQTHLDYDLHPKLPTMRRRLNLVLFLNPSWHKDWGGDFQLYDDMGNVVIARVAPRFNRAVVWLPTDIAYHGTEQVSPQAHESRITAAVYYLSGVGVNNTRKRALYVPNRS
jgi:hypothetical protein